MLASGARPLAGNTGIVSAKALIRASLLKMERVTIVEFESGEALREWRIHPEHAKAKRRGIESWFSDYKLQICSRIRDRAWPAKAKPGASV
jgi:heme-degrading monooxygenase HmoA